MTGPMRVRDANPGEWDGLLDRAERATVYHRDGWLGTVEATSGVTIRRLVCECPGGPVAVWPIALIRKGPLRVGGSPLPGWNTAYLGPLFMPGATDHAGIVDAMVRSSPIARPAFLAVRVMETGLDLSALGFEKTRAFETYLLGLDREEDAIWDGMVGRARTAVRKCEKSGVTFREEIDASYIDDLMDMTREVFARSNLTPPYSRRFLSELESRMRGGGGGGGGGGGLIAGSAMVDGVRAATIVVPHDGRTGVYFAGATRADYLKLSPSNLAMWEVIRLCRARGLKTLDMISTKGNPGRFKQSFGPEAVVSCVHWERTGSRLVRTLRTAYEKRARKARRAGSGPNA